jgi:hypothetical protein
VIESLAYGVLSGPFRDRSQEEFQYAIQQEKQQEKSKSVARFDTRNANFVPWNGELPLGEIEEGTPL